MGVLTDHRADGDDAPAPPAPDAVDPAPRHGHDSGHGVGDADPDGPTGDDELAELLAPVQLRVDFGDHFAAHYQRLVAQLYAITLSSAEAHDVVREAYSRAWRRWAQVGASPDPTGWVRRVAVRSTMRRWRRVAPGRRRRALLDVADPRTRTILLALGRLSDAERRAAVLVDMAGVPVAEVAALEQDPPGTVAARLSRARQVVGDALVELDPGAPAAHRSYPEESYPAGSYPAGSHAAGSYPEEDDW